MASNYERAGTDLDSVLAPYHSGWPQAAVTHMQVAGADFNTRYAPLSTGTAAAATNYLAADADLNTIFAAAGTTGVIVSTQPSNVSGSAAAGNPSGTVTSGSATCAFTRGNFAAAGTYTWHTTGCTATSPTSATTTFSATVNAGTTDNASAYCTGSDGVTSANTNTIAVALTNTTPATQNFTITAGVANYNSGYANGIIGSISPSDALADGNTIQECAVGTQTKDLIFEVYGANLTSTYISYIILGGNTYQASQATFSGNATAASWTWTNAAVMVAGDQYALAVYVP